uniref:MIF4G domain-containing protein n=1 Tax=viral metagenome TaxID=1070528 RepID=A0A6C0IDQ1_9ZZZZ
MTTKTLRYTLENTNDIIFQGFDYMLPEKTLKIISELALQVGSPDYVRTPIFQKRENVLKMDSNNKDLQKKKRGNKSMEVLNDDDWDAIRSFQTTKMEEKVGVDAQIDIIRTQLNKLTDKNYIDINNKIIEVIDAVIIQNITNDDMLKLSSIIFDIASTNRFYSKMYADIYSNLSMKYDIIKTIFEENLNNFTDLFNNIEYVDSKVNYDKFCENNKINERRKSLAAFYINLMNNGMITKSRILKIISNLLSQIYSFILVEDKRNEVDELTENIAIMYKKELYEDVECENYLIEGLTINQIIVKIANSKTKDYKSLTNKSLFKFMDMIEM